MVLRIPRTTLCVGGAILLGLLALSLVILIFVDGRKLTVGTKR